MEGDNTECLVDEIRYYDGDHELPMFSDNPTSFLAEEVAKVLMSPDMNTVCHVQPMGVTKNATFVIDADDVAFSDLKADDLGTWKATGTKSTYFSVRPNGAILISSGKGKGSKSNYVMTRRYYVHGTYQLFHRIITDIKGIF